MLEWALIVGWDLAKSLSYRRGGVNGFSSPTSRVIDKLIYKLWNTQVMNFLSILSVTIIRCLQLFVYVFRRFISGTTIAAGDSFHNWTAIIHISVSVTNVQMIKVHYTVKVNSLAVIRWYEAYSPQDLPLVSFHSKTKIISTVLKIPAGGSVTWAVANPRVPPT